MIPARFLLLLSLPLLWGASVAVAAEPADPPSAAFFARVGGETLSAEMYQRALAAGMRQRFYHGKVPAQELLDYRRQVAQDLVDRTLLLQEARRRKLKPDTRAVEDQIAAYDRQYASAERWQKERARLLPALRANLEEQSLLKALEATVHTLPPPTPQQVAAYYRAHPDKFTTPARHRVSVIMLKVPPSSPASAWQAAQEEAAQLVAKLRGGADFAELARLHSSDDSAAQGGDMGYLHRGMLAKAAEDALDKMQPGQISEPVKLLQGIAILRLEGRSGGELNPLDKVAQRASDLLAREQRETAWKTLRETLRKNTRITLNQAMVDGGLAAAPATVQGK